MQNCNSSEDKIIHSPYADLVKGLVLPEIPLTTFLFQSIRQNLKAHGDNALVVDAVQNRSILFKDVEHLSKNFASALTRIGFKKGDVMFYLTYNASLIYVLHIGVWLCGGATRGYFQGELKEEIARLMRQVGCRFALCEKETYETIKWASDRLGWPVTLLCIDGPVEGALPVEDMVYKDDGSAYKEVEINPKEDVVFVPSTNGSTGLPKGTLHTHFTFVAQLAGMGAPMDLTNGIKHKTILSVMGNFTNGPFLTFLTSVVFNYTFITISKFDKKCYFSYIDKYKPDMLFLYPYVANWFARTSELQKHDLSCVSEVAVTGSVFDHSTLSALSNSIKQAEVYVVYGSTEALFISSQNLSQHYKVVTSSNRPKGCYQVETLDGVQHVSVGPLLPLFEGKIIDPDTGNLLGRKEKGKLLLRVPYLLKGYLDGKGTEWIKAVDDEGWFDTGDIAFFDEADNLYIVDRLKSIFKYQMHHVSPAEIEGIIGEIPAVLSTGVIGLPNPLTTSEARAYVVIKPGFNITEEEIKNYVAARTPYYKHLHGGVIFMDKLPETRAGKIDRNELLKQAIEEMKNQSPVN